MYTPSLSLPNVMPCRVLVINIQLEEHFVGNAVRCCCWGAGKRQSGARRTHHDGKLASMQFMNREGRIRAKRISINTSRQQGNSVDIERRYKMAFQVPYMHDLSWESYWVFIFPQLFLCQRIRSRSGLPGLAFSRTKKPNLALFKLVGLLNF